MESEKTGGNGLRNLNYISWSKALFLTPFFMQDTVKSAMHKRRQFRKHVSIARRICSPVSNKNFYYN